MTNIYQQIKVQRFLDKLQRSINIYNKSDEEYRITVSDIKDKWSNNGVKHNMKIEIELSEKPRQHFYSLVKYITLPHAIDITDMTIEKIEFDSELLKSILKNEKTNNFKVVKGKENVFEYPTILAQKERSIVTGGFEVDYIYPVVKQNNSKATMTDEELNKLIRNDKKKVEFLKC